MNFLLYWFCKYTLLPCENGTDEEKQHPVKDFKKTTAFFQWVQNLLLNAIRKPHYEIVRFSLFVAERKVLKKSGIRRNLLKCFLLSLSFGKRGCNLGVKWEKLTFFGGRLHLLLIWFLKEIQKVVTSILLR